MGNSNGDYPFFKKNVHVFIGEDLDTLTDMDGAYNYNLHFSNPNPPVMETSYAYHGNKPYQSGTITLYVPKGSANAYRAKYRPASATADQVKIIENQQSPTSVSITPKEVLLDTGNSSQLTATVLPSNSDDMSVTWRSGNNDVATVDQNGKVYAVNSGETYVYATTNDGGLTDSCKVSVIYHVTGVSLNETSIYFKKLGETKQLTANIEPENATNKEVSWESSNKAVCTVSKNGIIVAVGEGTAVVTATTADGNYVATAVVTVRIEVDVTSVELNKHKTTLNVGGTEQLQPTVLPSNATNKEIVWNSADETIVSINNKGVLLAKKKGTTKIYACSASNPELKDSCEVEVVQAVVSIAVTPTEYRFKELDETLQLDCTIQPEDATNKNVTWKSSDANVCTVSASGLVTATGWGKATVTATTEDGGHMATCTILVKEYGVPASAIVWNETEFVYTGKAPQPTWTNTYNGYEATAEMPELEKNTGEWETTVPFTFKDEVDEVTVDVAYRYTIKPAVLTVTALDAERYEGEENPEFVVS